MSNDVTNALVFFGVLFAVVYTIAIARRHHYAPGYIGRVTGRLFSIRIEHTESYSLISSGMCRRI